MTVRRHLAWPLASILFIAGAAMPSFSASPPQPSAQTDDSTRPGDDFYRYANGVWLKHTALPDGKSGFDTRDLLTARNRERLAALMARLADPTRQRSALERQVGDYYASLLSAEMMDGQSLAMIGEEVKAIDAIVDRDALAAALGGAMMAGDPNGSGGPTPLTLWAHQGFTEAATYRPHLQQGGLGLPDSLYLDPSPDAARRREGYVAFLQGLFSAYGFDQPDTRAAHAMAIETALAGNHANEEDTGDPFKTNNAWSRSDLLTHAPGLNWPFFLDAAGLADQSLFIVWQPGAVAGFADLAAHAPLESWRDYLRARCLTLYAPYMPAKFRDLALQLADDRDDSADGWRRRAFAATEQALGEAIGRLYVERHFPPKAKQSAERMVAEIRAAFARHLARQDWLDPQTRGKAQDKLSALRIGLGYPDHWPDHWTDVSALLVVRGDALGNFRRAGRAAYRREVAKLSKPVDPSEWMLYPHKVGAVIDFIPNAIQFGAGILEPPFFDPDGDSAANYGSAGAAIAHEISHSFDLLGNIYDQEGKIGLWWTEQDLARFNQRAAAFEAQYDAYCPLPSHCVNGARTRSENIADLGGLAIAFDAYLAANTGKKEPVIDGMTGPQRFFLAFARRWRRLQSEESLRRQLETDSHAPGAFRAATVRNLDGWYSAFGIGPGDPLYLPPEQRLRLW